jgi:hypothetical protein
VEFCVEKCTTNKLEQSCNPPEPNWYFNPFSTYSVNAVISRCFRSPSECLLKLLRPSVHPSDYASNNLKGWTDFLKIRFCGVLRKTVKPFKF